MGKPEGNEPSFGEQVPGLGAPSEEWQEIFRAILSAKNAHGPDSEIAERKPFSFAELGGPDSGLADSDFGRDRDETEEKVGAMEDEMERRKRQAIVNRARNTDVNESGGDRM